MPLKLGKLAPRIDHRTLMLAKYLNPAALPTLPSSVDYTKGVTDWGMMLNGPSASPIAPNGLGCCTLSSKGHAVQIFTLNQGAEDTVSDATIEKYYEKWDGYVPGDPSTDNGGVMLDVLNRWRKETFAGAQLTAYAQINPSETLMVEQAIHLFGALDMGFQVPQSAMDQFDAGEAWHLLPDNGPIVGGHDTTLCGFDAIGPYCITWGKVQRMSWGFFQKYCDELYALFSPLWLTKDGVSPEGILWDALSADLAIVTQ